MSERELRDPVFDEPGVSAQRPGGSGCSKGCLLGCLGSAALLVLALIVAGVFANRFASTTLLSSEPLVGPTDPLAGEEKARLDAKIERLTADLKGPEGRTSIELTATEVNDLARRVFSDPELRGRLEREIGSGETPSVDIRLPGPDSFDARLTLPAMNAIKGSARYWNLQAQGTLTVREGVWDVTLADARLGDYRLPPWLREAVSRRPEVRTYGERIQDRQPGFEILDLAIEEGGHVRVEIQATGPGWGEGEGADGEGEPGGGVGSAVEARPEAMPEGAGRPTSPREAPEDSV